MIQLSDGASSVWQRFLEYIKDTNPLDYEKISHFVKIKLKRFPTDNFLIDYYQNVFSNVTNGKNKKKWHQMDKYLLIWCVAKLLQVQHRTNLIPNEKDWDVLAELLQNSFMDKKEDQILKDIASQFYVKNNWTELTIKFNSLSTTQRYPKQIRERWKNVLNPQIQKCLWDQKEKLNLLQMVYKFGKRWSLIQRHMKDRSENQIKNQYNAIMRNLKKEKISSEDETKLLQNIIQNPNQDMQKLIDGFLHEVRTKRDQNEPKITQKKIKMEVKNNLIIKEQNQMIKQIPEIKQNLEVQSSLITQNLFQYQPQLNNLNQYPIYQFHIYNSLVQQHFDSYQQQYQGLQQIQYTPYLYQENNVHLKFPNYK